MMRRILFLVAMVSLVLWQPVFADLRSEAEDGTPAIQIENITDETKVEELERRVAYLESMLNDSQLPPALVISADRDTGDILLSGGIVSWAGELPDERSFRLWCKQFDPSGFGNPNLIGLECGWTPGI